MSSPGYLRDTSGGYSVNFTNLCGAEGLAIWNTERSVIGICFQQLFLDIPVLGLLAIFSSYYIGQANRLVARGRPQLFVINTRCFLTLLLAFLPLIQIYVFRFKTTEKIPQIAYFLSAVQGLAWFVHFLYLLVLRKKLGKSPRGPMIICILRLLGILMSMLGYCILN